MVSDPSPRDRHVTNKASNHLSADKYLSDCNETSKPPPQSITPSIHLSITLLGHPCHDGWCETREMWGKCFEMEKLYSSKEPIRIYVYG